MNAPQAGVMVGQFGCDSVLLDLIPKVVPIVAIEPLGANCFYSTMALNEPWKYMHGQEIRGAATDIDIEEKEHGLRIARLRNPKTRVTSLGAASPHPKVVDRAMMRTGGVVCVCVPDEMVMSTAISFAGDVTPLSYLRCDH